MAKTRELPTGVEKQILAALAKAGDRGLSIAEIEEIVDTGGLVRGGRGDDWGVLAQGTAHVLLCRMRQDLHLSITGVQRYYLNRLARPLPMVLEARAKREAKYAKLAG